MSANNYILIRKEGVFEKGDNSPTSGIRMAYVGYEESASAEAPSYSYPVFKVFALEEAILHAQGSDTEYGYRFEGLGEDAS